MEKKKKKRRIALWIVLGAVGALVIFAVSFLMLGQGAIMGIKIKDISAQGIADGTYTGSFDGHRWSNTLSVTVSGEKITGIGIMKDQSVAVPDVSNELFADVIEKQSAAVDTVSGATVSSKAYLKAVQNALQGAG
jgi:uncharacterized protein with FMN-binding domain